MRSTWGDLAAMECDGGNWACCYTLLYVASVVENRRMLSLLVGIGMSKR